MESDWDALVASRKRMARAVRGYLRGEGMAAVDIYAEGNPRYRGEIFKFAAYVQKFGEPEWFV